MNGTLRVETRLTTLIAAAALTLLSINAWAQRDLGMPAPPFQSDTLVDDGTSILNNPANAAFQPGAEAGLGLRLTTHGHPGDGYYGYGSWTAPRIGFNVSGLLGVRTGTMAGLTGAASIAWGKGPIAIGLRYRVYSHDTLEDYNGLHTSDVGLTLRPWNALALSLVIENLWNPTLHDDLNVGRGYRIGIATRTLHRHFMMGASAAFYPDPVQSRRDLGLELRSDLSSVVALFATGKLHLLEDEGYSDWSAAAGLSVRFGHIAVDGGAQLAGAPGVGDQRGFGGAGLIRYIANPRGPIQQSDGLLLRVQIDGRLDERPARGFFTQDRKAFVDYLVELRTVAEDDRFAGVYLHLDGVALGVGQLWELRQALDAVRQKGKRVVVYLERGGLRDLYLAASADFIMTAPSFTASDSGLAIERIYVADLLERIGVHANFLRVGEYKSAVEMFTRGEPSEHSDEALAAYLNVVWDELSRGICRGRPTTSCPQGRFPFNEPINADTLLAQGWSQRVGYEDELRVALFRALGKNFTPISWEDATGIDAYWRARPEIGVIHIDGMIMEGGSGANPLTGGSFTGDAGIERAVRAVLADHNIKGVIVRISSPGGSAFASDEMLRSLQLLHQRGLPVRISMGNEAASGGYYVTAFPTKIWAAPTTLTGSIGIYAGTFEIDDLLSSLGVHRQWDRLGGPARLFRGRAWTDEDMHFMQSSLDFGYRRFVQLVADARDLTFDDVDARARGRIWSGVDAKDRGLVHELGSFLDAYDDLCREIPACRRAPLPLRHMTEDRALPLPAPISMALGAMGLGDDETHLTHLVESLGLRGPLSLLFALAPQRAGELRQDLGGGVFVRFE